MNLYRNELIQDYKEAGRYDKTLGCWLDHLEKGNLCHADVMRLVAEIDRLKVREKRDCAAIIKLREKLKEANARIAELENQQEWHDASEPPDDDWWVLVEVVDKLGVHDITPGWYEVKQGRWNIEYAGWYDILRWRELPGWGKE